MTKKKSVLRLEPGLHTEVKVAATRRNTSMQRAIEEGLRLWLRVGGTEVPGDSSAVHSGLKPSSEGESAKGSISAEIGDAALSGKQPSSWTPWHEKLSFIFSHASKEVADFIRGNIDVFHENTVIKSEQPSIRTVDRVPPKGDAARSRESEAHHPSGGTTSATPSGGNRPPKKKAPGRGRS